MLQHRYGHLFRSDSHSRAMDAIADAIDASSKDEPQVVGFHANLKPPCQHS
jgi:hypothetical protein